MKTSSFGEVVNEHKHHFFIGREKECAQFQQLLKQTNRPPTIMNIYGLGGIGKSYLLDRFEHLATSERALVIRMDSRDFSHTPEGFSEHLAHLLQIYIRNASDYIFEKCMNLLHDLAQEQAIVFIIDTYEQMHSLDHWLRESFIKQLPKEVLLIISGRMSLQDMWRSYPHWQKLLYPVALEPFNYDEVTEYLQRSETYEQTEVQKIYDYTNGHPLTLVLITDMHQATHPMEIDVQIEESLNQLVYLWLDEIESERLRYIVEAASLVRSFEQSLLEYMIEDEITAEEFKQLIHLSFIRKTAHGWMVHDILQDNLSKEIRLRTPTRYRQLWKRSVFYYYKRLFQQDSARVMEDLFFVLGDSLIRAIFFEALSEEKYYGEQANDAHYDEIKLFLDQIIAQFNQLQVTITYEDYYEEKTYEHHMPVDYFQKEAEMLQEEQLLSLGLDAFHLIRNEVGKMVGLIVMVPIHEGTIQYLLNTPVPSTYFSQLTEEDLTTYATAKDEPSGGFLRLIALEDDQDHAARAALMYYLLSLWFKQKRSIVSTSFSFYYELLERLGFEKVPDVCHEHYGAHYPAFTYVLDLRDDQFVKFLDRLMVEAGISETPLLADGQFNLTPREREITHLVIECLSTSEIAKRLFVSDITVKKHLSNIYEKAGVKNRFELLKKIYSTVDHFNS